MPSVDAVENSARSSLRDRSGAVSNISEYLTRAARAVPGQSAIIATARQHQSHSHDRYDLTFAELEFLSNRYANTLRSSGLQPGDRALVMVRPGIDFIALIFAMFKAGIVPVLIDPGMGLRRVLECVRHTAPQALIGIRLAHGMRLARPSVFKSIRHSILIGRGPIPGSISLHGLAKRADSTLEIAADDPERIAAILFTSGSTGLAKGVVYKHRMFAAQVEQIRDHYAIGPGGIDLPTFPLFALFNPAMQTTSVIPNMDASRPGRADPAKIVAAIETYRVSSAFGSPALWSRVANDCAARGIRLHTMKRILVAGAPVPSHLVDQLKSVISVDGEVYTPYGATEALPITSISGSEIVEETARRSSRGAGICVGRPFAHTAVRIMEITDRPFEIMSHGREVDAGDIGEIVVRGDVVTESYDGLPDHTRLAKIADAAGIWHRMGDVGYVDGNGRLWFCGRKAHRVETAEITLFSIPCEAIFNEHPEVLRSALVGVRRADKTLPVIVIELRTGGYPHRKRRERLVRELRSLAQEQSHTHSIEHVLFHRRFPVDVRHNAKIDREALARWAARRLR